jgi:hypothetical protein
MISLSQGGIEFLQILIGLNLKGLRPPLPLALAGRNITKENQTRTKLAQDPIKLHQGRKTVVATWATDMSLRSISIM